MPCLNPVTIHTRELLRLSHTPEPLPRRSAQLFTRRSAALLFSNQRLQRWCFDVELLYLADSMGIPVCEVGRVAGCVRT